MEILTAFFPYLGMENSVFPGQGQGTGCLAQGGHWEQTFGNMEVTIRLSNPALPPRGLL